MIWKYLNKHLVLLIKLDQDPKKTAWIWNKEHTGEDIMTKGAV